MENNKSLKGLIEEVEKIFQVEKCRTCQCFYDMLLGFWEVLNKEESSAEVAARLAEVIKESEVTHDCLGCDPCYPVPILNILSEMTDSSARIFRPVCKPATMKMMKLGVSWPVEQGEYIIGNRTAPVAISTLGSDELVAHLAARLGKEKFAIIGKTHTENIGIEKIVKNTVTNPDIRFLVLCGKETKGHMAGQSLLSLFKDGINHEKKVVGSEGKRPILKNLDFSEVEHIRAQVEVINLIASEDLGEIEKTVVSYIEKNPGRFDKSLSLRKAPHIEAQPGKLVLDPAGFFIIYPNKEEGRIYLEHYRKDGTLNEIVYGEDPVLIASTAVERGLVSRLDHAAYLGRELGKAFLSMCYGFQYIQDSAPGKEQPEKYKSDLLP